MNLLDKRVPPYKTVLLLSWPTIVEQILQTLVGFADTAMVGSLGAVATASISVCTSTLWLLNGILNAFAIGFCVLMARSIGSENIKDAKLMAKQCFVWTLVFGVLLTIIMSIVGQHLAIWMGAEDQVVFYAKKYMRWIGLSYLGQFVLISTTCILQNSGDTKTPLMVNILNNIINICLNFFFIFEPRKIGNINVWGAGLGVQGAAMATCFAAYVSAISLSIACFCKDSVIKFDIHSYFAPKIDSLKKSIKLSTPVFLEKCTLSGGQLALTAIITFLGTEALAAHYVANTAESITYLPTHGFATAATTLVAQSLGANDKKLAQKFANLCCIFGVATMTITGLGMYVFAKELVSIFSNDPVVIKMGSEVLKIEAFCEPFFGLSIIVFGILRGARDTKGPFLVSLLGMWIIRIPLAYLLVHFTSLGLSGAWIPMMIDLTIRGSVCFVLLRRKKWLRT